MKKKKVKLMTMMVSGAWISMVSALLFGMKSEASIADSPAAGQSNTYNYTGTEQTWTVPATGYYDIYCYGAQGGYGYRDQGPSESKVGPGAGGDCRASRVLLTKGLSLTIHAGQMPPEEDCSYGEGSTNGEKWEVSKKDSINGVEVHQYWNTLDRHGSGHYDLYRGWSDGSYGQEDDTFCDDTAVHSGGAVGGGGGGSSYVLCGGTKIISAKGGKGADVEYKCPDGSGSAAGGQGGGVTTLAGSSGVTWVTSELNYTSNNNTGNGKVVITYVRPYFEFKKQPASQTVKELGSVSLAVDTTMEPNSIKWQVKSGSSWKDIKDGEEKSSLTGQAVYSGSKGKILKITDIPYEYDGNTYRCVAVYEGQTFISQEAAVTVTSGLLFDEQPKDTARIEEEEAVFTARSAYAQQYGTFQWQTKNADGSWVNLDIKDAPIYDEGSGKWLENPEAGKYAEGVTAPTLSWECSLADNNTYYRCVITTTDGKRTLTSNAACLTVVKKDFNKILAQYNREIEYGSSLDINEVYVSMQYTNGKVDFASGWENLYFLIDGKREKVWTPDQLGTQTVQIVFVDDSDPEEEKEYPASLKVTVVDTLAPKILTCSVSEHDVSNDPSKVQKIIVTASAEDLYTPKGRLLYALVEKNRPLTERDYILADGEAAEFELVLNQNKSYTLYVKDENGNVAEKPVEVTVLDIDPPVIEDISLLMQEKEWYPYNVMKITAADDYLPEKLEYRIGKSEEELNAAAWQTENEFYINSNGAYIVEVKDFVGNKARDVYQVTDIDAAAPDVEGTIQYDFESDSFFLSAKVRDTESGLYTYRKQTGQPVYIGDTQAGEGYEITFDAVKYEDFKNSIVLEVTDKAGNTNFYQFVKNEEEYASPAVTLTRVTKETGEWLDHVIIRAEYSLEHGTVPDKPYSFVKWDGRSAPEGAGTWIASASYSAASSGTWRCYVRTSSGAAGYADITISDVDAEPPEISFEALEWNWSGKKASLHYDISDTDSGIARIIMQANSLDGNQTYDEFYGQAKAELEQEVTLYANAVYTLYAYDIAGHESYYRISCGENGALIQNSVTVVFKDYDGSVLGTQIIAQGGTAQKPEEPERKGYLFKGWDRPLVNIQEDCTIIAVYTAEDVSEPASGSLKEGEYTVSFVDYDGVVLKTQEVKNGGSASAPEDPKRSGYTFRGWNNSYRNVTKDTTCTAVYEKTGGSENKGKENKNTKESCLVEFKDYNGVTLDAQVVDYGKAANAPENPVREGYVFKGWDKAFSYVTEDITVTAVYEGGEKSGDNPLKTGAAAGGMGSGTDGEEEMQELEEEDYINVSMLQVEASELAVDNEEYETAEEEGDILNVEKDTHTSEVTQKQVQEEEKKGKPIGFWLTIAAVFILLLFIVFYKLNRKYGWVNLPDIPLLNFNLPFGL